MRYFNVKNTRGNDMEVRKHDCNDAESINSMGMTARELIHQNGLHRVYPESYETHEYEFAHSIVNKEFDLLERSNNDEFIFTHKLEKDIISRFCNGVIKSGDVGPLRLLNYRTLELALSIEHEIIAARRLCLQRNVLTISNFFIYALFEIADRIKKFGFLLCCGQNGDINNLIMLDEHESRKSFPNLQATREDGCVSFSTEFRLDLRLDESMNQWTNFKNLMKPVKSV